MSNWSDSYRGDWIPGWILVGFVAGAGLVGIVWEIVACIN